MAVIDLLLRNVAQTPDMPAVIAADGELSFRELDEAAGRIATRLYQRGVCRGDTVAMALDNAQAAHFTASYFGIHKLGAIPVPMNVRWAAPEKEYVLAHSDAVALICGDAHTAHFAALSGSSRSDLKLHSWLVTGTAPVEGLEALGDLLHEGPIDVPPLEPAPDMEDPADLLYTSGTTGMPKGVLVPQGNLADQPAPPGQPSITQALAALFGERLLHAVPLFGFTGCHGLMLMCARAGITQVALPRFDPETLLASIEKYRATSIMGVPTMLNLAMKHPSLGQHDYSSLQFVFFGAAPIQPDTVRKMLQVWPDVRMLNAYGLTEGGLGAACMLGPDPQEILNRPGCVGRPAGCEAVIVDDDDRPLPQGEVGEICFRSDVSHRHYYKNDALSAELWRSGMLHTGDVGYLDAEGFVYITDRKKDMVLRGGYNIFAVEVERVLLDIPEVLEAAVVGIPHPDLGEDILAVIVPRGDAEAGAGALDPERINAYSREHLADYKCPRHVVFVDELPKNAMAKILKNELRQRYRELLTQTA
ncbi:acyl--CoA ligase [Algiphilus sp. NNCM1]|jgi:acyl-CoA synthetase (AMP-forming)/AMP-acid ligase II|uniref:class I adenylate-forming enzyme family protein n=1 Tax=Algiphilus sp. TaxID=1872431 RepID=UPI001CA69953|nr:class I adenylate-forming enzyme family protein [Algiphilus sp.]MBY8964437.1 acyl--CoA ligase [Algiphilus acroporae]MCI5063737.1 acyl--CoA ligase [Algiphilus sp.]MCI5103121.1 acyl--CoA ligase [Algiphilus sp.]